MRSGNRTTSDYRRQLGRRDRAILADVMRYRVLTNELVHLRHLPAANINATTKVTQRLADAGWLQRHSCVGSRLYFVAGRKLCQQFGLPISRARPLGAQTLATSLAIANFCLTPTPGFTLLDAKNIQQAWDWIPEKLRTLPMAIGSAGDGEAESPTLRLIRVDLGGTPAHISNKCLHDFKHRAVIAGFGKLLSERRLVYVVLTTTDTKKELIKRELQKRSWPAGARFEVIVVSDLSLLLTC